MRDLRRCLRLMLITDGEGNRARLLRTALAAIDGGVRCVQVREPRLTPRELIEVCEALRPRLEAVDGLLLVNDRVALAASGHAHGVHLGQRSLPPCATRRVVDACRDGVVVGISVHDAAEVRGAGGADYVLVSPVFKTRSHPGGTGLGPEATAALAAGTSLLAVWLGGIDLTNVASIAPFKPAGIAVMRAVTEARDPRAAAEALSATLLAHGM